MEATPAYLGDGPAVYVPERRIAWLCERQRAEPLRGHSYVLAVMEDGACIGWITTEDVEIQAFASHGSK